MRRGSLFLHMLSLRNEACILKQNSPVRERELQRNALYNVAIYRVGHGQRIRIAHFGNRLNGTKPIGMKNP